MNQQEREKERRKGGRRETGRKRKGGREEREGTPGAGERRWRRQQEVMSDTVTWDREQEVSYWGGRMGTLSQQQFTVCCDSSGISLFHHHVKGIVHTSIEVRPTRSHLARNRLLQGVFPSSLFLYSWDPQWPCI